jgi:hypothetical protein
VNPRFVFHKGGLNAPAREKVGQRTGTGKYATAMDVSLGQSVDQIEQAQLGPATGGGVRDEADLHF